MYLLRAELLPPVARYLDVSEPPAKTDYVMVLGGNAATRPFVAAALVRAGLAKSVLVPRVQPSPEEKTGLSPPEHVLINRVLLARGVSESAIIRLDGDVGSTSDEARRLADFLAAHPEGTVAIVTTGMHTRRARWIFERAWDDSILASDSLERRQTDLMKRIGGASSADGPTTLPNT